MVKKEIVKKLKDAKPYLVNNFHIKKIGIFGSYARNEQTKLSDIDLLIELDDNIKNVYITKKELKIYLSGILKMDVDLACLKYLKSYVKKDILDQVIYV